MRGYLMIDWNLVIENLKDGNVVTVDPDRWNMLNPEYQQMLDLWKSNNFEIKNVRWINYYNTKSIEKEIADSLNITPLRSWISCVEPGYMTGYHYDIDDNETEYLTRGIIKRFSIFISEPAVGHLFILDKDYFYNKPQGSIIEWQNYRDWHNGINGGFSNKYMFHILGY
jgi:hypothetical protein